MHRNNILCSFGCKEIENQTHIFTSCTYLKSHLQPGVSYKDIYGNTSEQKKSITQFVIIEQRRLHLKKHLLPGGNCGQDPCKFDAVTPDYAADVLSA